MISRSNRSGFSLIELLLAVSIMSILALGFSTMLVNVSREQRSMQEKFGLLELQNTMMSAFADGSTCLAQLNQNSPTLNLLSTSIPPISYQQLLMGSAPTSPLLAKVGDPLPGFPPGQLQVLSINLDNIVASGTTNVYGADLLINIDPSSMVRSFKPAKLKLLFTVTPDPVSGLAAAVISSCGSANAGMGDWKSYPTSSGIQLAPSNGMLMVTSCGNCGIRIHTAMSNAGSCASVTPLLRIEVSARDKYGQGVEDAAIPVKKGECWTVEMTDVHQSTIGSLARSIFFRPL